MENITLIGMPGAGKSTVGIILAKLISLNFFDTDLLIQINAGENLQSILDREGHMKLRDIEEEQVLKINIERSVIATGGSVPYSEKAMDHLKSLSIVVYLSVGVEEVKNRIHNFSTRGIAKAPHQSFEDLFLEREVLYKKHADITVDTEQASQEEIAEIIAQKVIEFRRKK